MWEPKSNESVCELEKGNIYNMVAIKTGDEHGRIVGHLPREISRITKFIMDREAKVQAQLLRTHYRRLPFGKRRS